MTPEQIEVAARKACELIGVPCNATNMAMYIGIISRHRYRPIAPIDLAIKYALEQK